MNNSSILVYKDQGVAPLGVHALVRNLRTLFPQYTVKTIRAKQLVDDNYCLDNVKFFVMPGGRDRFYHQALSGKGNHRLRSLIEQGATYVGICGGAYYGASLVEFAVGTELEIIEERELGFFPGKAVGPLFQKDLFSYHGAQGVSEKGACLAEIDDGRGRYPVYYNGGCYFPDAEKYLNVSLLARYIENGQLSHPAIISCKVGNGCAILSGVHYEIDSEDFKNLKPFDQLDDSREEREKIFRSTFIRLL